MADDNVTPPSPQVLPSLLSQVMSMDSDFSSKGKLVIYMISKIENGDLR